MYPPFHIRTAQAEDEPAIVALLTRHHLPVADIKPALLAGFLVASDAGRIVGVVGCEQLGEFALYRSLAVAPEHHGRGLATALVAELEQQCRNRGIRAAYLLTRTAETFAAKRGFRPIPRSAAPAPILNTGEFRHACCASARCMMKDL